MKKHQLLMAAAMGALLAASACSKKGSNNSGGGATPQLQEPDPLTPPRPVTGYCYGIHGCTAAQAVVTTREVCEEKGGTYTET